MKNSIANNGSRNDTRACILNAVRSMVACGETTFSMSHIARESGVSKSSLYYFFKDKKDLCTQVLFSVFDVLSEETTKILNTDKSPKEKILAILIMSINASKKEGAVTAFIFQKFFEKDQEIQKRILIKKKELKNIFVELIEEGIRIGEFQNKDSLLSSELLVGFLDFMALTAIFSCSEKNPNASPKALASHFLFLLQAP
jgi:AcrR family transcriptional regulator